MRSFSALALSEVARTDRIKLDVWDAEIRSPAPRRHSVRHLDIARSATRKAMSTVAHGADFALQLAPASLKLLPSPESLKQSPNRGSSSELRIDRNRWPQSLLHLRADFFDRP
jgi:hypothetical protein